MTLEQIFDSPKRIDDAVRWKECGTDWWGFLIPLSIEEVTIEGLILRGKSAMNYLDRGFLLQIEYRRSASSIALARSDWRALHNHNNKRIGPEDLRFVEQKGSHLHRFDQNYLPDEDRMRGSNLPIATPISPDHETCQEYIDGMGKYFRISNMEQVVPPPAQPVLL